MGVVYLAYDLQRDMEVAIKLCTYPQLSPLHIKREFRVAASLRHPNLVEFYELIYHKHQAYFTMEYVDGTSLRRYVSLDDHLGEPGRFEPGASALRMTSTASSPLTRTLPPESISRQFDALANGPGAAPQGNAEVATATAPPPHVDFDRVRDVLGQLASGLARLHAGGVVHRDVKPSNALVTRDGTIKLLDFGLARDSDHLEPIDGDGHLVGTAAYLAPEYIDHLAVSPALDLYALGVVGYELCTGSPPFGGTLYSIARIRKRVAIPNAQVRNPAVPDDLDALLAALISSDPAARPSAAQVAKALLSTPEMVAPMGLAQHVVGRAAELGELRRLLDNTSAPQLILITGAAGIGKSTLMQSALQHLRSEETLLWRGFCYERERVPYRAFDAIIDDLADALAASERLLDDLPFAAALARVFPALAEPLAPFVLDMTPAASNLRVERERALVSMAELIARQAESASGPEGRPYRTVIAIENLQWIDAESVELMTMLLQLDRPMTIVATCTTESDAGGDGMGGDDSLPEVIAELARDHTATARIDLSPLGLSELLSIVETAAPRLLQHEQRALAAAAAGSPYLAEVLARDADRRGVDRPAPRPSAAPEGGDAPERRVRAAVATAGTGATFDQLRFVTELPSRQIQSALRALEADRVLRALPSQSGDPTYDFYHEVLRTAAYASIPEAERRLLHAQFAGWYAKGQRPAYQALTEHWHRAGRHTEAARAALAGADASLGQLAFGAAADWYRRALEMSQLAAASDPEPAVAMVVRRARIGYAEATYLDGDIGTAARLFRELSASDQMNREHWLRRMTDAEHLLAPRLGD
jgi:eukaryotic-like serine/threonine-protein kinase